MEGDVAEFLNAGELNAGEHEYVEAVGRDAIVRRLRKLAARLDGLNNELAANQREYEELQHAYRIGLAEHDQLTAKLRAFDITEIERQDDSWRAGLSEQRQ